MATTKSTETRTTKAETKAEPKTSQDVTTVKDDEAASTTSSAPTRKYVVKGGSIHTASGKKRPGDVVELTSKWAKHFNRLDRLGPYLGDDDEDEDE